MNFDSVNYSFLLQDFIFAAGAGFAVGFLQQLLAVFLYGSKTKVAVRDMLTAFIFAVVVFSYTISFANYPDIRIYHILGAFTGFLTFDFEFSAIFQKFFKKIYKFSKDKILCCGKKVYSTICGLRQKYKKKDKKEIQLAKNTDLKNQDNWVYNL